MTAQLSTSWVPAGGAGPASNITVRLSEKPFPGELNLKNMTANHTAPEPAWKTSPPRIQKLEV
jgi:hypothetical protein